MAGYDDRCRAKGVGMGTPRGPQRQAAARARAVIGGQLLTVSVESGRLDCGVVHRGQRGALQGAGGLSTAMT
jgi:hypothetical protein